jgi:hypothetical protein
MKLTSLSDLEKQLEKSLPPAILIQSKDGTGDLSKLFYAFKQRNGGKDVPFRRLVEPSLEAYCRAYWRKEGTAF